MVWGFVVEEETEPGINANESLYLKWMIREAELDIT